MPDLDFGSWVDSLADYYASALHRFQPSGALLLGGYCVGAVIALAMADKLQALGREIGPLLMIEVSPKTPAQRCRAGSRCTGSSCCAMCAVG